jgi:hypothetical protein
LVTVPLRHDDGGAVFGFVLDGEQGGVGFAEWERGDLWELVFV